MDKDKLTSALIQLDQRESTRKGYNQYALALYLQAADDCADMVSKGMTWEQAFTECYTPSRGMHTVAKQLGLRLDVIKGQWVNN